jgi:hypothetical protein
MNKIAQKVASRALLSKLDSKINRIYSKALHQVQKTDDPTVVDKIIKGALFTLASLVAAFITFFSSTVGAGLFLDVTGIITPEGPDLDLSERDESIHSAATLALFAAKFGYIAYNLYKYFYGKKKGAPVEVPPRSESIAQDITPNEVRENERFVNPDGSVDTKRFIQEQERKLEGIKQVAKLESERDM